MSQRTHDYLLTPEAADLLRVSPATLAKWRVLDKGPHYHKIGHVVLYGRTELIAWLGARHHRPGHGE